MTICACDNSNPMCRWHKTICPREGHRKSPEVIVKVCHEEIDILARRLKDPKEHGWDLLHSLRIYRDALEKAEAEIAAKR